VLTFAALIRFVYMA